MKHARIVVSAIAIFAVVGAALAFKAPAAFIGVIYTGPDGQHCTNRVIGYTIAAAGVPVLFASTTATTACAKTAIAPDQ